MLNILPPKKKAILRKMYVMQQLVFLVNIGIIASSISVVMILASNWGLERWLTTATALVKTDIITSEEKTVLRDLVINLNRLLDQGQPLLVATNDPVADLLAISEQTPSEISLHTISINYPEQEVLLTGTANTRDDLIAYQQTLNDLDQLNGIHLPLSDITLKEKIPFNFSASYEAALPEKTK